MSQSPALQPSTADLRGFLYPLDAVMRRQQWQLDRLRGEWARCQRATRDARLQLIGLDARREQACLAATNNWASRPDVSIQSASIAYLARIQAEVKAQRGLIGNLARLQSEARAQYLHHRQRLAAIERHREQAVCLFVQEQLRRSAADADRDWLSRSVTGSTHWGAFALGQGEQR
jgi:hypothetical protein